MSKDYGRYSFWLETSGDDLTPRPPLDGSISVDVAILGAGLSGLWTAYHLLQADPSLNVAILEAEIAGFGASGRNGGWCYSGFPTALTTLAERYGTDAARAVQTAMFDTVDNVGEVCEREGIDAHFIKSGSIELARGEWQMPKIEEMYHEFEMLGLGDHAALLDANETAEHLRVTRTIGSFWNKEGASVQPARLTRGLARAVERHGGTIYEQTRVTGFVPGPLPRLDTERGNVSAQVIVLAGEAYLSQLPQLSRQVIPMTSHIVVTEPLSDDIWQQIGWERREVVGGWGTTGGYLNHTADGRIAFGPYSGRYPYGSRISDALDLREEIFELGRKSALDWFPMLKDVKFTHAWGGVLGVPRDRIPTMSYDRKTGIARAYGYSGEGVATTNLSGRVLADLITEKDTELTRLPMTTHVSPNWEPEPVRWTGITYVRRGIKRMEEQAEETGAYPKRKPLAARFWN